MIEPADNPDRNFKKMEILKVRDPVAPSNFCGAQLRAGISRGANHKWASGVPRNMTASVVRESMRLLFIIRFMIARSAPVAKRQSWRCLDPVTSLVRGVWQGRMFVWGQRPRSLPRLYLLLNKKR